MLCLGETKLQPPFLLKTFPPRMLTFYMYGFFFHDGWPAISRNLFRFKRDFCRLMIASEIIYLYVELRRQPFVSCLKMNGKIEKSVPH